MKKLIILLSLFTAYSSMGQDAIPVNDDTTRLKAGKTTILVIDNEEEDFDWEDDTLEYDHIRMEGEIDFGMNGYMTSSNSLVLPATQNLMELDYSKSRSFSANLMLKGADVLNKRLYISPGIGLNWNSFTFKNNIQVSTANDTTDFTLDTILTYDKYKLKTTYLQIPLVIGVRMGNLDKTPFGLQVGVVGGYKLGAKIKRKYSINETDYKNKIKDDYNINPFKIDAIARLSVGNLGLYARYSLTSLFETNKAPVLYPFSVGLTVGGF